MGLPAPRDPKNRVPRVSLYILVPARPISMQIKPFRCHFSFCGPIRKPLKTSPQRPPGHAPTPSRPRPRPSLSCPNITKGRFFRPPMGRYFSVHGTTGYFQKVCEPVKKIVAFWILLGPMGGPVAISAQGTFSRVSLSRGTPPSGPVDAKITTYRGSEKPTLSDVGA